MILFFIKSFIKKLFENPSGKQPEDFYNVAITDEYVKVEHPQRNPEQINWKDIDEIAVITTDEGPLLPDFWLVLMGKDNGCSIPQGAQGYDDVFDIVSKYEGFNFDEYIKSTSCAENARFDVWKSPSATENA